MLATLGVLLLTAIALLLVRSGSPLARWLALLATLSFGVVAGLAPRSEPRVVEVRAPSVEVSGQGVAARTAMLVAAANSGPRAVELQLVLQQSASDAVPETDAKASTQSHPTGVLGATASSSQPLPFAPGDVRLRAVTGFYVDRPASLEFDVAGVVDRLRARFVIVDSDGGVVLAQPVALTAQPVTCSFTPRRAGLHELSLEIDVVLANGLEHMVYASGSFEVATADEVLCVSSSGVIAAALQAQGVRVRDLMNWPSDWQGHQRIVLDRALTVAQQEELATAVAGGVGLFVLPEAFGEEGEPLRALLPLIPRPEEAGDQGPAGDGSSGDGAPDEQPPEPKPSEPPVEPPAEPPERDDVGKTDTAGPISKDPTEVDKHAIAMVLVVDRSGSMAAVRGGKTKMDYARESARRTALALDVGDRVGAVTFGTRGDARIELPMTAAVDTAAVQAGIARLRFRDEPTFLLGGLRSARAMLLAEPAAVKHVVVISDGEFRMNQTMALRREAHAMRTEEQMTVSIISIVDSLTAPGFKEKALQIAADGGGAFVAASDVKYVPSIVSSEVSRALSRVGRSPRKPGGDTRSDVPPPKQLDPPDSPERPEPTPPEPDSPEPTPSDSEPQPELRLPVHAVAQSSLLAPEPDVWPTLGAAVPSDARLDARVLLVVGVEGWPLLAFANRGLGRVAAFGAPLAGVPGIEFRSHPAFPGWLAQWLAATSVAEESVAPTDVRERGGVTPRAPLPDEVRWLSALSGRDSSVRDAGGDSDRDAAAALAPRIQPAVGRTAASQVAQAAPWLLLALLLLAVGERLAVWYGLRRGRS